MNHNTSVKPDSSEAAKSNKRAYQSPTLVLYGNISEITQMVGVSGMDDGGSASMQKTS